MAGCELGNLQMMTEVIETVRMLWGEQRCNPGEHSHLRSRQEEPAREPEKVLAFPSAWCMLSCVQPFATPWTIAHQAPLSVEFSSTEYQSGLPFPYSKGSS